jgi:hypothetical protein
MVKVAEKELFFYERVPANECKRWLEIQNHFVTINDIIDASKD